MSRGKKDLKLTMFIAPASVLALAASLSACSSSSPPAATPQAATAVAPTPTAKPPSASVTSSTPTATPVGTWTAVSTSDPADMYGQYSIIESDGEFILTTSTALKLAGGLPNGCSLPPGTEEATFSASSTDGNGPAIYQGTEKYWYENTCGYSDTKPATLGVLSADKMVMTGAITLIRIGNTPVPVASSAAPTTTAPAPVTTIPATAAGATLWCGQVAYGSRPVTITPLSAWLSAAGGYPTIQALEGTLHAIQTPGTPQATLHALAASLCSDVGDSEATLPPVGIALFDKAMNNFLQASVLLRTSTDGTGEAGPYLQKGIAALDAFLAAVGKPAS
jgi:hypothetical protein